MTLYEGRVKATSNQLMDALNKSLPVDIKLLPYDVITNKAWAKELARLEILSEEELSGVIETLDEIVGQYNDGAFNLLPEDEDIHTLIERLLTDKLGATGAKIHTGRSRNDQVACDLRLYVMDQLDKTSKDIAELIRVLTELAEKHKNTLLAGTTHLQPAQPITLGHFLLSLSSALVRDYERLMDCKKRASLCPLGAGALSGCGFVVNRIALAKDMGFSDILPNSLDAISDRDAAQEASSALAICASHLSRYAEQFVIWSNPMFGYVRFSDDWSTGSSMMPQKRNPDAMELVRGKTARIIGDSTTLLTLTKGVPLSYAKDLQEDKASLFDAVDNTRLVIQVFTQAIASAKFNKTAMKNALTDDLLATDIADRLVESGIPFRKAHERVANFVTAMEQANKGILSASSEEINHHFPEFDGQLDLCFESAVNRRQVKGGCSDKAVQQQIDYFNNWLSEKF